MKNNLGRLIIKVLPFLSSILPALVSAQTFQGPPAQLPPVSPPSLTFNAVSGIGCTIVAWMFTLLIIAAVIFAIIAAITYLTAGGNQEKVGEANKRLIYTVIAVAVAVAARAIPLLVGSLLPGPAFQGC